MVTFVRLFLICAAVLALPTITVAQSLTVERVWTRDAHGSDKAAFAPGETIQFSVQLKNSYGGALLNAPVTITTHFYNNTKTINIPNGVSTQTWNATVPSTPNNYPVTVRAYDSFYGRYAEGGANFTVTSTPTASVPVQPTPTPAASPPQVKCAADAYFIGTHGTGEGPDGSDRPTSQVLVETAFYLLKARPRPDIVIDVNYLEYPSNYPTLTLTDLQNPVLIIPSWLVNEQAAKDAGVSKLDSRIQETINKCKNATIVLVGYSLGAWVIDDWLGRKKSLTNIKAVVLYGDPLWYRKSPEGSYGGVARRRLQIPNPDPYMHTPPGYDTPLQNRWQSHCLQNDPVCGEGYRSDLVSDVGQTLDAIKCIIDFCEHKKYALSPGNASTGYGLTKSNAEFLAQILFGSAAPLK